jgi:hypothetical protein
MAITTRPLLVLNLTTLSLYLTLLFGITLIVNKYSPPCKVSFLFHRYYGSFTFQGRSLLDEYH